MKKVAHLAAAIAAAALPFVAAAEGEAIPFRGVVEGYYGRPWGTEGRLSMLKFMGENGLNTFIYGPKDDPYHHAKWREAYPAEALRDFRRLLVCAAENRVTFYWAVHLGGGFKKGCEGDYAALFRKLGSMYDSGFRAFAVFFDDFGSADAEFHAEICNRVVSDFLERRGGCAPLVMCPNVYSGSGRKYQRKLGELLDRRVQIMWTGARICSDIRAEDVEKVTEDFRRPPFVWWNWPVNDYCRSSLLLGRAYGLDKCALAGIVSNPMENCEASKVALYGFAKWCRDPGGFDSRKAWEEAFKALYPDPRVATAMRVFAEHNSDQGPNVHGYRREESASAAPLCARARGELERDGRLSDATAREVSLLFGEVLFAAKELDAALPKESGLGWEIEGWVADEMSLMGQGLIALELLSARGVADAADALGRLRAMRGASAESARRHREKFAAATFAADRRHVKSPVASVRELRPLVEKVLETALGRLYKAKTGAEFAEEGGPSAFSTAKALGDLTASREGRVAGLGRVMEPREVAPGEAFGIALPKSWETDYFHARLGSAEAAKAGVVEVSKDGKEWKRLATRNRGAEMQTRLDPAAGWRQARWRNASSGPVMVKIDLFKFDVAGAASRIDRLLGAL